MAEENKEEKKEELEEAKTEEEPKDEAQQEEAKAEELKVEEGPKDDMAAKIAELSAKIEEITNQLNSANQAKDEALAANEAAMAENKAIKADATIKAAVDAGKLTPAQAAEGSWFVKLAHDYPEYFAGIMEQMEVTKMPTQAQLQQEKINQEPTSDEKFLEVFEKYVSQGLTTEEALSKAHAEVGK